MKSQMANEESEVLLHTRVDDLNDEGYLKRKKSEISLHGVVYPLVVGNDH